MRSLVTGAGGMLGSLLLSRLLADPALGQAIGVDLRPRASSEVRGLDLNDSEALAVLLDHLRPDVVYHCAGGVHGADESALVRLLVETTERLLDAISLHSPATVVVVPGSAAEYGTLETAAHPFHEDDELRPVSPYGRAKARQSAAALARTADGLDVRVGRIFNLIGPGVGPGFLPGKVASSLVEVKRRDREPILELGDLTSVRDFIDVRDAVDALVAIARVGREGRVYNICSGCGRTTRELVDALVAVSGLEVTVCTGAAGSVRSGLDVSVGSNERIMVECGWKPACSFEQSIADMWERAWSV